MKINYQETTNDLLKRINIHDQYGGKDIDKWMLSILPLTPGLKILDVACGTGKQCFSFFDALDGKCNITGGDVSKELLAQAEKENLRRKSTIRFMELNFNETFPFSDNEFDLVSCCFAIYYSEDIKFTLNEIHRILKPGGCLFTTGPMPENKSVFYDIIREATNNKPIPRMPGSSRYGSEILDAMKEIFSSVKIREFKNPLTFSTAEPFLEYTRASLSEDRKLWGDFFKGKDDFEKIMRQIAMVTNKRIDKEGKIVMTKVVGGFIATR